MAATEKGAIRMLLRRYPLTLSYIGCFWIIFAMVTGIVNYFQ